MKDVDFDNLKSLVEYMYKGEANVPQNMLASFIKTAESLQVRGLAECATKQLESEGLNASNPTTAADLPPAATSTPTSSLASKVRSFTSFILQLHSSKAIVSRLFLDVFPQLSPTQVGETLSFSKKILEFF